MFSQMLQILAIRLAVGTAYIIEINEKFLNS